MMKIPLSIVCSFTAVLILSGCAMFTLSSNTVEVVMEPEMKAAAPARIYIDGDFEGNHYEGMTPPKYELSCGEHKFKILAEGYADWEKDIIVLKGDPHRIVALIRRP